MAGPTFAFLYLPREAPTLGAVGRALHGLGLGVRPVGRDELGLSGGGIGSMFVGITRAAEFTGLTEAAIGAFTDALGGVPEVEVHGYAMVNGPADWAALRRIAERIAERFGGLVREDAGASIAGAIVVEHRDLAGFFGPMLADAAYVRANGHLVPAIRHVFVPARGVAAASVRK